MVLARDASRAILTMILLNTKKVSMIWKPFLLMRSRLIATPQYEFIAIPQ